MAVHWVVHTAPHTHRYTLNVALVHASCIGIVCDEPIEAVGAAFLVRPGKGPVVPLIFYISPCTTVCYHDRISKWAISIHGRRDERYAPSVLCICSVYVIVCDVHAIIDQIRDEGVGDIDETGRTVETAFITASLYERVNFPGRGMCSLCTDPWSYMCGQVVFLHYLFITSARVRRVLEPLGRSGGWAVLATHLRGALPDPPVYHR